MRELTKSMMSYTLAMSAFGVQQLTNMALAFDGKRRSSATQAFNELAQMTTKHLSEIMNMGLRAGDSLQRGVVDMMFGCSKVEAGIPAEPEQTAPAPQPTVPVAASTSAPTSWSWGPPRKAASAKAQPSPAPQGRPATPASGNSSAVDTQPETGWAAMP